MLRRAAFILSLLLLAAYVYAPLWEAGPIGSDLTTLLDVGPVAWPAERGDGAFTPLDLYHVDGVDERPLAACLLAGASRLLTVGGRLTGAEVDVLRMIQFALLLIGAWGLARFVRRALLPWFGADGASTAGYASSLVLALHPLAVSVVARPASVGDLVGLVLATWAGTAFLRGRQDREHGLVVLACVLTIVCGLLTEIAYFLALTLALVELSSARRYRPFHVRLRTAGTTLAVFGGAAAVELGVRVAVGAPVSVPGLVGVWLEGGAGSSLGEGLAVAVEKLGILIMPVHPFGGLGALAFVVAGVALLLSLEPALVAARSAPRQWSWLLGTWCAAIALVELSTTTLRVPPETLAGVETLFPAVIVMAVGLGVSATALSGTRRTVVPLVAGVCYAILAHGAAQPYQPAASALAELRSDLDRAREQHGRDAHFLVLNPPESVDGLEAVGDVLPLLLDPALTGEPETPTVEGLSDEAFFLLCRQPELTELRRGRLVLLYDGTLLGDVTRMHEDEELRPAASGTRRSVRLPAPGPRPGNYVWRADPSTPLLENFDPLHYAAVRITVEPGTSIAAPPVVVWRSTALIAQCPGVWLAGGDGPVAYHDLSRSLAWLVGEAIRRVRVEGELVSGLVSGEILEQPPVLAVTRRRDAEDWRFEVMEEELPRTASGPGAGPGFVVGASGDAVRRSGGEEGGVPDSGWQLSLLDLATYAHCELPAAWGGQAELVVPGAAAWQERVLRAGGGPIAWSLDLRLGESTLARASGRLEN